MKKEYFWKSDTSLKKSNAEFNSSGNEALEVNEEFLNSKFSEYDYVSAQRGVPKGSERYKEGESI